ncbi:tRNA (adenosine(37)-N6)-threonylcarbamoyltransferase complex ATPase subunit type 1 TsaE [Candidatus Chlamydia corallus]|uniref:tRNA (adenosine(37)-N6)-threonylcarbamoyltransferase complex ATPase subunit type 1 TsaE n=1 Tax=Candidatus Chlamydia corallus TaxID=2038470 RepID=UPI000C2FBAE2|nr:tRNA (adenosine(37)-N6)-threonylcarbamoyltransferase complex ATPase subunit type 1 TsaE [Candidatus Chlamydia corallus]
MGRYRRVSRSSEETLLLGAELGRVLLPGAVLLLFGDYGAGKTEFVRGLVSGYLGDTIAEEVASPSFSMLHVYGNEPQRLCHYDLYRIDQKNQEYIFQDAEEGDVLCIEWADRLRKPRFRDAINIYITMLTNFEREIIIVGPQSLLSVILSHTD